MELSQLIGHEGPVWQVTWAHPKFGSLLASCSLDHKVIVWKETQEAQWVQVGGPSMRRVYNGKRGKRDHVRCCPPVQAYCSPVHTASVNGVAFAPHELGLMLAAASSDGTISVLTYQSGQGWGSSKVNQSLAQLRSHLLNDGDCPCMPTRPKMPLLDVTSAAMPDSPMCVQIPNAHPLGVTAVSWAPAAPAGSLIAAKGPGQPESRFASSGADNIVKVLAKPNMIPTMPLLPQPGLSGHLSCCPLPGV